MFFHNNMLDVEGLHPSAQCVHLLPPESMNFEVSSSSLFIICVKLSLLKSFRSNFGFVIPVTGGLLGSPSPTSGRFRDEEQKCSS